MSVRRERFRCPKTGKERFYWRVDIVFDHPDGSLQRVRKASPVNTRKGAEQYERQIRQQLLEGTYNQRRKEDALENEGAAAPTVPTAPTLKPGAAAATGATGAAMATGATGATGAAMATGAIEAIEVAVPTFKTFSEEFMTVYAQTNNKPSEVQSKESILGRHLLPAFGQMRLDEIKQRDIERYKSQKLALELSPKTINNQLTVLRRLLAVAVEWEIIPVVPPIKWLRVPPQSFDFLDFEEAERLLAAAEEEWRPMITLAFRSGLRQGELLALRWGDVDLEVGQLVVRRAVARGLMGTPKNGRTRAIPLSEATVAALLRAPLPFRRGGGGHGGGGGRGGGRGGGLGNGRSWGLRRRERVKAGEGERRDEDLIFCDSVGNLLSKGSCKWPLWRACGKAGLRKIGWHTARHSFASHLTMRGVPLKVVQELLGHQTIQMTMRYSHLTPDVRRGAIELLEGEGEVEMKVNEESGPQTEREPEPETKRETEPARERVPKSGPGARPNNGQTAGVINADEGNRP